MLSEGEPLEQPVAWQVGLAYETSSIGLDRVRFSGLAEEMHTWSIHYDVDGLPLRLVTHGLGLRTNLVYQPTTMPLQLMAGVDVGLGFASPGPYETVVGDVVARPDPDQSATVLRGALPIGLRVPVGFLAIRGQVSPGAAMVSIDEVTVSSQGSANGTSVAVVESVRGRLGLDITPFSLPVGMIADVGYDFGRLGGWSFATGIAYVGEPSVDPVED